jgi:hypothetical protein
MPQTITRVFLSTRIAIVVSEDTAEAGVRKSDLAPFSFVYSFVGDKAKRLISGFRERGNRTYRGEWGRNATRGALDPNPTANSVSDVRVESRARSGSKDLWIGGTMLFFRRVCDPCLCRFSGARPLGLDEMASMLKFEASTFPSAPVFLLLQILTPRVVRVDLLDGKVCTGRPLRRTGTRNA